MILVHPIFSSFRSVILIFRNAHKKNGYCFNTAPFLYSSKNLCDMYRIVTHSYPNNEIRTVFSAIPNPRPIDYSAPLESSDFVVSDRLDCIHASDYPTSEPCDLVSENPIAPAPLSLPPNSKTRRYTTGYGALPLKPTKFGLNAKRTVLRSGGALEKSSTPNECLFLTGTLPGSTEDSFRSIAAYSAYLVNGLKAWISNYIPNKLDFYVWEYQKRGALHLHYCIHAPDTIAREFILKNFKAWWIGILHKIGEKSNCDLFKKNSNYSHRSDESKVRARAEVCRKSPARYLAKYLTKSIHPKRGNARFFTPSRWFGVSRPLTAITKSMTKFTEIIIGSYHAVVAKLEDVAHICDSSESVTYQYRHSYGVGKTYVCYPNSQTENKDLWNSLVALSTTSLIQSTQNSPPPSEIITIIKTRLVNWYEQRLSSLSPKLQGLKEYLSESLSLIHLHTPSLLKGDLSSLMTTANRILDTLLLYKSSPYNSLDQLQSIKLISSDLEDCISEIVLNGYS